MVHSLSQQANLGPLFWSPRCLGSSRYPEKWFSVWGTAKLLPGNGVRPRESSHRSGTTVPFVQACPPDRPRGLQALGFSPATKYHFIGFCDICLVLNTEPCSKGRSSKAAIQEPEFWDSDLFCHQKNGQPATHASLFLGVHLPIDKMKKLYQAIYVAVSSSFQQVFPKETGSGLPLKCNFSNLCFLSCPSPCPHPPHLVLQRKCIWKLGKRKPLGEKQG